MEQAVFSVWMTETDLGRGSFKAAFAVHFWGINPPVLGPYKRQVDQATGIGPFEAFVY